jgi:hypothetical protein
MRLRRVALWTAKRAPRTGYALAWLIDRLGLVRSTPRPAVSPPPGVSIVGIPDLALAARAGWSNSVRYALIANALGSPVRAWPRPFDVVWADVRDLPSPAVLATVHIGPMEAAGLLLDRLDREVLGFTAGMPSHPRIRSIDASGGEWARTAGMLEAVRFLRDGGVVFLAVDASESTARFDIPLLGRQVSIALGAFAVSRLSGAPLVPIATRWRDRRIEIERGPTIPATDALEMGTAFGGWLEEFVLAHPVDLGPAFVGKLLRVPMGAVTRAPAAGVPRARCRV